MADHMSREEQVKFVMDRFNEAEEGKSEFMQKAKLWHEKYMQYQPPLKKDDPPNTPNHVSAKPFSVVELAIAKQRSAIIPQNINDPILRVLPRMPEDIEGAKNNELLLDYYTRLARLRAKLSVWLRSYNKYGVAPARIFWRTLTRKVTQNPEEPIILPLGDNITIGIRQIEKFRGEHTIYDAPDFEPVSIDDWFPDPAASSYDEFGQNWVIIRYYVQKRELLKLNDTFDVALIDKEIRDDELPPARSSDELEDLNIREVGSRFDQPESQKGLVELLELYDGDSLITIANRKVSIRPDDINPYNHGRISVVCPSRIKEAGKALGMGQIEPIHATVEAIISLRNSRSKNVNLSINKMWKVIKDAGIDVRQLRSIPGGRIDVTDMDDIDSFEFPDVTANAYQEEVILNNDIDLATGLAGLAAGVNPPSVRSGIQTFPLLDIANERTIMDVETFIDEGLIPLAQQFTWLAHQFAEDDIPIRVLGPEGANFQKIPKEDIGKEFDYLVESSIRTTPKAVEAQLQLAFLNSMAAVLQGFPDFTLRLFRSIAQKQGLKEVVAEMNQVIEGVEQARQDAGGILQTNNQQVLAGGFGAAGGQGANPNAQSGGGGNVVDDILGALEQGDQSFET